MKHSKHTALARPALGRFGRNEWAIVGTHCSAIRHLSGQLIAALNDRFRCAYVDADHSEETVLPGMLASGARAEYTDAIGSHRLQVHADWNQHQFRQVFNEADLILVNGNHHQAARQIVVIDPAKENSLRKRLAQLSDVRLILLADKAVPPFGFLAEAIPNWHDIPQLLLSDTTGILAFFEEAMQQSIPLLNGLVLAGGHSLRMGRDKGAMDWHGKPQREYVADLLAPLCAETFISCRAGQETALQSAYPALPDTFADLGPYGAILSAFRHAPDRAWLVVACDLPLLDAATLDFLLNNRRPLHTATAFESPFDQMPEPLITIWEPKSYAVLLSFLAQGYSCPRKVLLNSDAQILKAESPEKLTNVNTPEEAAQIRTGV
ncbi:MAG: NTP transferase domain-containing protein [Bacteroidetes bacterium]|nr:NTP transferase domain-containing protein [Bacteroidota bacterium]